MTVILGYGSALEYWRSCGTQSPARFALDPCLLSLIGTSKTRIRDTNQAMRASTNIGNAKGIGQIIHAGKYPIPIESEEGLCRDIAFRHRRKPPTISRSEAEQLEADYFSPSAEVPGGCLLPASIITTEASGCTWRNCVISHHWGQGVPKASLIRITQDFYLSTPEFTFLQMAAVLPFPELVLLGFELCSSYSPTTSGGATPGIFNRNPPLSTKAKLAAFISRNQSCYGAPAARHALEYVIEGSASSMEAKTAIMLCFPYRMGGYGLPLPQMNAPIRRGAGNEGLSRQELFFCDMLWREQRLGIEYDSDCFHANSASIARDARRRNALESMGWKIITVTNEQVKDVAQFDQIAQQVAKVIRKRLRFERAVFEKNRAKLRKCMLSID